MLTYSLKPWLEPKRTMSWFLVIWTHSHLPVPSVCSEKVRNKVMPPVPLLLRRQPFFTESSRNAVLLSPLTSKLAPGYFWVTLSQITKLFSSKYCSSIFYNLINKQSFFQLINNYWHLLSQVPFHAVLQRVQGLVLWKRIRSLSCRVIMVVVEVLRMQWEPRGGSFYSAGRVGDLLGEQVSLNANSRNIISGSRCHDEELKL